MLFNSFPYLLVFLPICIVGYYLTLRGTGRQGAVVWLILSSLVFYGGITTVFLPILLGSMSVNFLVGRGLVALRQHSRWAKPLLVTGIVANVASLAVYKYTDFFLENLNSVFGSEYDLLRLALPLGISFFTFKQISYLVETYRGAIGRQNVLDYFLFVSFFPQLIAGPIVRHEEFTPQLHKMDSLRFNWDTFAAGVYLFFIGLVKKSVFAETFGIFSGVGYGGLEHPGVVDAWVMSLSYTMQIYFDFSGYTDMALGSALLLGFTLPQNFHSPYHAVSVQDFWRRWHITLSRWLRDYIYIPLGGNRHGEWRTHLNLMLTFLVGGLWHGAGWTFLAWGFLHGAANSMQRLWGKTGMKLPGWLALPLTFLFINVTWVFFRATSFSQALDVLAGMVGLNGMGSVEFAGKAGAFNMILGGVVGFAAIVWLVPQRNSFSLSQWFRPTKRRALALAAMIVLGLLFMNSNMPTEFLYFDF